MSFSSTDLSDSRENETHEISLREPLSSNASTSRELSVCQEVSVSKNSWKWTRKCLHGLDDVETAILSKLSRDEECDSEEHFVLHVASILRTLPPRQCALTKIEIDKVIFSAQFPKPSHQSAPCHPYTFTPYLPTSPTNYSLAPTHYSFSTNSQLGSPFQASKTSFDIRR